MAPRSSPAFAIAKVASAPRGRPSSPGLRTRSLRSGFCRATSTGTVRHLALHEVTVQAAGHPFPTKTKSVPERLISPSIRLKTRAAQNRTLISGPVTSQTGSLFATTCPFTRGILDDHTWPRRWTGTPFFVNVSPGQRSQPGRLQPNWLPYLPFRKIGFCDSGNELTLGSIFRIRENANTFQTGRPKRT